MISYLKGILVSKVENSPFGCFITIEVNDIGYQVFTNPKVVNSIGDVGEKVKVYTVLIHKEDSMSLCGFITREDRDLFLILQSVSGVGAKVALLLLSVMEPFELVSAVISGDTKAISSTKGIGPKLAQRIILELKDKLINWREKIQFDPTHTTSMLKSGKSTAYIEAESVLVSLGYSKDEADKGLMHANSSSNKSDDAEELLRLALQWLANL